MSCASEAICAEVLERATRLYFLGERTSQQLEMAVQRRTAQSASAVSIKQLVADLVVKPLLGAVVKFDSGSFSGGEVLALLETVALIHEGALPTVPRVVDPIELSSFLRLGKIETDRQYSPLVFASERLGTQIYPNSLAGTLRQLAERQMNIAHARSGQMSMNSFAESRLKPSVALTAQASVVPAPFISIPSIDIDNPRRWPSLWHELGHHDLSREPKSLISRFQEFIDGTGGQSGGTFNRFCNAVAPMAVDAADMGTMSPASIEAGKALVTEWLRECWCDHYGIQKAGLAFLYSQLHDFMFCFENYLARGFIVGQPYPPAIFRLRLVKMLANERLRRRNPQSTTVETLVNDYEREQAALIEICRAGALLAESNWPFAMRLLYNQFLAFFKRADEALTPAEVMPDVEYESLSSLESDLREGLPVPAISNGISPARAATCAEIVLAGWRDHLRDKSVGPNGEAEDRGGLRSRLFLRLQAFSRRSDSSKYEDLMNACRSEIERSDECLKRSIQVSEWFSILHGSNSGEAARVASDCEEAPRTISNAPGLIPDVGIRALLQSGDVKIVPVIDLVAQVKGSSIDLRLGHNFEIFSSPAVTAIDACGDSCDESSDDLPDSLQVEVDLLRGRPIFPGQFILGHTLEYIKLPGDIAAQIEGRSSFARLGIQVHMTANLVEAGFEGCLTLEILNSGHSTFMLYPGMRIAQLRLFRLTDHVATSYEKSDNKYRGQLSQNRTKQFSDREVDVFKVHRAKRFPKKGITS